MSKRNIIQEYFKEGGPSKHTHYDELFNPVIDNIDVQTQVSEQELRWITTLEVNDKFLASKGIKPLFNNYITKFLKLKISLDRQGRREYVEVNKDHKEELLRQSLTGKLGMQYIKQRRA